MQIIAKHIEFVKDQVRHYDSMARKFHKDGTKSDKYIQLSTATRDLLSFLESLGTQAPGHELPPEPLHVEPTQQHAGVLAKLPPNFFSTFGVSSLDVADAPEELKAELKNITESDKLETLIVDLINAGGGVIGTDKLVMGLYHLTGDVHQRGPLVAKLYRMAKKGLVFSVPKRKGVYTTTKPEGLEQEPESEQEQLEFPE